MPCSGSRGGRTTLRSSGGGGAGATGRVGHRPDQALRRGRGGPRDRPRGGARGDLRVPRPQRRGQVDHDQHPVHPRRADERDRRRRGPRRRRRPRGRPSAHRPGLPGAHARRPDVGGAEPALPRRALRRRPAHRGRAARGGAAHGRALGAARGPGLHLLRRDAAAPGDRARAAALARRCSSSTSPRSGSTRRPARRSGTTWRAWGRPRRSPSSSPRTTWTRPSTATGSRS